VSPGRGGRSAGRAASVTGAGSGIGTETPRRFAAGGARVGCADGRGRAAEETAAEIGGGAIGLELDVTQELTRTLGVRLNAAFREASFRAGPYSGNEVPLVPRQAVALRADWTPLAGHRLSGGVNWVSSQHPDFANACTMPSYVSTDARYAYQIKAVELALGVTNLFDRKYFTQAFGCAGGQVTSIYPEAGRAFTASARFQF